MNRKALEKFKDTQTKVYSFGDGSLLEFISIVFVSALLAYATAGLIG